MTVYDVTIGVALEMNPADFTNCHQGTLNTMTVYDVTIGVALEMNQADFTNCHQGTLDTMTVYDASEPHKIVSFIP